MNRRAFVSSIAAAGGLAMNAEAFTPPQKRTSTPSPASRRRALYSLMGALPPRDRRIGAKLVATEDMGSFERERLVLDLNGIEPVPAYFIRPKGLKAKGPSILFNHWHGGEYKLGKDEMMRPKAGGVPSYAQDLTDAGYTALCIDHWVFGERSTRTEMDCFKEMLWKGQVMWGMMVYDSLRALDYLLTRAEVDPSRVGTLGMSMGSTMAWWVAALDERLKVCVDICCLTDFQALIEAGNLKGHGIYYYVPSLLNHFTASSINALIAPRPHLGLAGNLDALTPPAGLDRIDADLKQVYAAHGKPENWKLLRYEVAHVETPEMRREVMQFLREKL
jgi:dienelactone hydrolase